MSRHPNSPAKTHRAIRAPIIQMPRRPGLVGGLAVALAVTGVGLASHANDNIAKAKESIAAAKQVNAVQSSIVVLKSGANYRLSPSVQDGSAAGDLIDNKVGTVPKGMNLVIKRPLRTEAIDWVGALEPVKVKSQAEADKKIAEKIGGIGDFEDRARHSIYADVDQLQEQGLAEVITGTGYDGHATQAHVSEAGDVVLDNIYIAGLSSDESATGEAAYLGDIKAITPKQDQVGVSMLVPANSNIPYEMAGVPAPHGAK